MFINENNNFSTNFEIFQKSLIKTFFSIYFIRYIKMLLFYYTLFQPILIFFSF